MLKPALLTILVPVLVLTPFSTAQTSTVATRTTSKISPAPVTTTFLPTSTFQATSSQSPDPWQCATKNITQYFDVPKPSSALRSALDAYGEVLIRPCLATATGLDILSCSVSETTKWCGFATTAQPSMQTSYSAYGGSAASWYEAKSAAIESAKTSCPVTWAKVGALDQAWLNQTIAHAKCYEKAHPGSSVSASTSSASKGTGTSGAVGASSAASRSATSVLSKLGGLFI